MVKLYGATLSYEHVLNTIALDLSSMCGLVDAFNPKKIQRQRQPSPQLSRQPSTSKNAFKLHIDQADVTPAGYGDFDGTSLRSLTTPTRSGRSVRFSSSEDVSALHSHTDVQLVLDMSMPTAFKI